MSIHPAFELIKEQEIPEINTQAQLLRHKKTGAEILSLANDDENKSFGITFRTPPHDSTGVAHIMEHSVLCGSRKYPLKEPFVELVKGSLNTFLNAITFPDKTCYPVASQNEQDFYNLVDVYLDAVFYPRISPEILQQEGWHYDLEDKDQPMSYKGVVFNEMKGAYSSPDGVFYEQVQQTLFPHTTYGFDSGGDPKEIPNLTYEQFKSFHDTYYHPSNSRIYFYGDDDPAHRLEILEEYLKGFEQIDIQSEVTLQDYFEAPKQFTYPYAVGEDEEANSKKGYLAVSWLLPESLELERRMSFSILNYVLMGTSASPLRKALIDSGLGEDIAGGGLASHLRQMYFSAGLKGIDPEDADKVDQLVLGKLKQLAQEGLDSEMVEAAFNITEFRLRENNTGSFPRGLSLMFRALSAWLHDGDPISYLSLEKPLAHLREKWHSTPAYFENMITQYLLDNQHRVTLLMVPDPELRQKEEAQEKETLAQLQSKMSEESLQEVIENTRELRLMQETPDTPEALATIPSLTLDDLDKEIKTVPRSIIETDPSTMLYHDLFTNGIAYIDIGFDMHAIPQELIPYLRLFSRALLQIGTETEDFVKLSQRIDRKTGGVWTTTYVNSVRDQEEAATWLILRGKGTMNQIDDLLQIMKDVLLTVKLDNQERFKQMVLESKARAEARLIPGGHGVIDRRLRARFNEADWFDEQLYGVSYLFFLRQLVQEVDQNWSGVLAKLEKIRQILINREGMICNITLDEENWRDLYPQLSQFIAQLPLHSMSRASWSPEKYPAHEGLTIPAQVNYVGKGAKLYDLGYQLHGSISVITNFLRTSWLWERVRVQGGAYGGFCSFGQNSGVFSFLSYRDPNLLKTLENYDQTSQFLKNLSLTQEELTKSIIGAIGRLDAYRLPDAKGYGSMLRYLNGLTDEFRQQYRDEVLGTTVADFKEFAKILDAVRSYGNVVIMGSQEQISAADESRGNWLEVIKVL